MKNLIQYQPHTPANTGHIEHYAAPEWEVQNRAFSLFYYVERAKIGKKETALKAKKS